MRKGDKVFGELAVELGMMSREQLARCVTTLQRDGRGRRLIDICRELDVLSADEVKFIIEHHRRSVERTWAAAAAKPPPAGSQRPAGPGGGAPGPARGTTAPGRASGPPRRFRRTGAIEAVKAGRRVGHNTEIPIAIDLNLDDDLPLALDEGAGLAARGAPEPWDLDDTAALEPPPLAAPVAPTVREQTRSRLALGVIPVISRQAIVHKDPSRLPTLDVLLRRMVAAQASDLHLSAGCPPLMRCHGAMQPLEGEGPLSQEALCRILLEIAPARAQDEFATTNDVDFAYAIEGLARFRANYFVDRRGIGAVFRQIPMEIMTPRQLGLPEQVLGLCKLTKGLVLVTGPTGSGKSTTLATLIDVINTTRDDHIITIEDPIEFVHENKRCLLNQREVGSHTRSFKVALRAALREDPDIVLVGELRDLETIAIAIETAETGHLVFGTLHTTTAPSTVDRIIDQFPADRQAQIRTMLAGSLRGVIAQVLCKRRGGGRVAAYEILMANAAVANLIREGKSHQLPSVMQTGRALGMQTMNEHLLELVRQGQVDPEEAVLKAVDKQALRDQLARDGVQL